MEGHSLFDVPRKDLTHQDRLLLVDLDLAVAAMPLGGPSVPVRQVPGRELTHAGPVESPASSAFDDLRSFVLGDDPLDLKEELVVWGIAYGPLAEVDIHTCTLQLLQEQSLVGVLASESVRTEDHHHIEATLPSVITECVEGRSIQLASAESLVGVREGRRGPKAVLLSILRDGGELALDRSLLLLHLGRNPGVEGSLNHPRLLGEW
jgi:hypothetical protein